MKKKAVAIITARGGSKRIPNKNIKLFCGKPIILYSIDAAMRAGCFDEVMVSTDSEKIAALAREAGAKVPFMRSERSAGDFATTIDVITEVIQRYSEDGKKFDLFCCLYPTAPFVKFSQLSEAMKQLENHNIDAVISVVQYSFPPQRSFVIENEMLRYQWPENMLRRSQDLSPMYHDAGQFYCGKVEAFLNQHKIVMDKTYPVILSDLEAQDIDNPEDWSIAEIKYKLMLER